MKALLLIDIQNQAQDDFHKDHINENFLTNVKKLIKAADKEKIPVFHILTEYTEDSMPLLNKQKGYKFFMKGTYEAEEIESIAKLHKKNHYKVIKQHYDSFWNTRLDEKLRSSGVDTILIAGVYTHWCVLSTVFSAMSRGYNITVFKDCVGSRYPDLDELIFKNILDKKVDALQIKSISDSDIKGI
jgi:nicotinamidase-related amidase